MINQIFEWSQGNAGAVAFLTLLVQPENTPKAIPIVIKLEEAKSTRIVLTTTSIFQNASRTIFTKHFYF